MSEYSEGQENTVTVKPKKLVEVRKVQMYKGPTDA